MTDEIPVTEARARFSELINRVGFGKEHIVLTRHGKPLVALVPAETLTGSGDEDKEQLTVLDLSSTPFGQHAGDYTIAAQDTRPPKA